MREPHSPQENEALEPSRVTEYHPATNYKVVNLQESDSDCEIIDNIGGESNQKIQQLSCVVISSEESDGPYLFYLLYNCYLVNILLIRTLILF